MRLNVTEIMVLRQVNQSYPRSRYIIESSAQVLCLMLGLNMRLFACTYRRFEVSNESKITPSTRSVGIAVPVCEAIVICQRYLELEFPSTSDNITSDDSEIYELLSQWLSGKYERSHR
jgi:hypothetical protein